MELKFTDNCSERSYDLLTLKFIFIINEYMIH